MPLAQPGLRLYNTSFERLEQCPAGHHLQTRGSHLDEINKTGKDEIQRDLMDGIDPSGAKMTVCELYKKHTGLESNARVSMQKVRNQLLRLLEGDKIGHMPIKKVKLSDAKQWGENDTEPKTVTTLEWYYLTRNKQICEADIL